MTGVVRFPRQIPAQDDPVGWARLFRDLNNVLMQDGQEYIFNAETTLSDRSGVAVQTVLQRLGDTGRATDQRLVPMVNFGNVSSVQSADPLSATAGVSTSDVTIAAHTLHTDFGNITYNSGSILGLNLNTRYYIYADDPNFAGGAVTYVASTSRPNVPANSGRYFVGTLVTPLSASTSNISAATSANPIVFTTSANHGWSTGDTVDFAGLPGDFGTNLNTGQYTITVLSATTFSVAINGSAYAAYTSGGSATRVVPDSNPDYGGGGGGILP